MAGLYILAGINHFIMPRVYLKITPPWVPRPSLVNWLVGAVEITLGILLLFEKTQSLAAWGIILLLIAIFPANFYHFQLAKRSGKIWVPTLLRLPVQVLLIGWAYTFTG